MILEQVAGLYCLLVATIDQDHAITVEVDEGNPGQRLCGGREQRRHLGTCRIGILRPPGGLADIGVDDVGVAGGFREQRRLLRAADDQRLSAGRGGAELFQLRSAELARGQNVSAATATLNGRLVERHGIFARADQDF